MIFYNRRGRNLFHLLLLILSNKVNTGQKLNRNINYEKVDLLMNHKYRILVKYNIHSCKINILLPVKENILIVLLCRMFFNLGSDVPNLIHFTMQYLHCWHFLVCRQNISCRKRKSAKGKTPLETKCFHLN